ncbi:MAG: peptidylprolyl isomerase [Vicinamibacteria bacterium]
MLISTALALMLLIPQAPAAPAPAQVPAPEVNPTPDGPVIAIDTTMGTIQVGLYATKAPASTRNIMSYVKSGFYTGTTFHRVIPGFMIQGGGMDVNLVEKPTGPPVRNEAKNGLLNRRGSLSLARTNDPQSATSQFFISVKDNPALDFGISRDGWGYAVFGEVLSGMEVVDAIVNVPTTSSGVFQNVPVKPVVITKVRIISEPAAVAAPPTTRTGTGAAAKPAVRPAGPARKVAPKVTPKAPPATSAKPTPTPSVY